MKKIIIFGSGSCGREVAWLISDINKKNPTYQVVGFLDNIDKCGTIVSGYEVLGGLDDLYQVTNADEVFAVIALQDSKLRKEIVEKYPKFYNWINLIHPSAIVADSVELGIGNIICANVTISVDTFIKNHCLFNISTTIGHDCEISDYVSIMSNCSICGHVEIGEGTYIATNVSVIPGRKIGCNSTVAVGSAVLTNIKSNVTVMGNPAKIINL